jgi:hypothetical protein
MWQESASGTIINRSAIIELVWVDLCSDVVGGCRPVLLDAFILSYLPWPLALQLTTNVRAFQHRCFSAALLADWLGGESELKKTLCVGRTSSREGESSRAPVVVHVQATGLALHCSSKMASNRCTAAYATSFSRTATLEIPRGDLTSAVVQIWRAGVLKHLHSSTLSFPTQVASAPCTRPLPAARAMHKLLTSSDPPPDLVEASYQVNLRAQQEKNSGAENSAR